MSCLKKTSSTIICRLCNLDCIQNNLDFAVPCKCDDAVCTRCLRREIELKNRFRCEDCNDFYKFSANSDIIVKPAVINDQFNTSTNKYFAYTPKIYYPVDKNVSTPKKISKRSTSCHVL